MLCPSRSWRIPAAQAALAAAEAVRIYRHASTGPLIFFFCCAVMWLLVASAAGLTASIKLHGPHWLTQQAWLTFGRIRTIQ